MAHQIEAGMGNQVLDIALAAGKEIVDAYDLVARRDQPIAQMRAQKAGATCYQD